MSSVEKTQFVYGNPDIFHADCPDPTNDPLFAVNNLTPPCRDFRSLDDTRVNLTGNAEENEIESYHRPNWRGKACAAGFRPGDTFVTTPVCSPSRAATLTGMYGHEAGVRNWVQFGARAKGQGIDPDSVTTSELLKQAGYSTSLIGKWHLGEERSTIRNFMVSWAISRGDLRWICRHRCSRRNARPDEDSRRKV
ncbi:MAG: sulfatase-like hydrolase/transferase [Verrucomicrobiales bacterium]|nr:sulfatase-like hydrolase/transferase [Verrucomicrobiales bacterium]